MSDCSELFFVVHIANINSQNWHQLNDWSSHNVIDIMVWFQPESGNRTLVFIFQDQYYISRHSIP